MQDNYKKAIKATVISIAVALIITGILILVIYLFAGQKIDETFLLVNMISITSNENKVVEPITIDEENKSLENYPEYGTKYGTLEIENIDVNLPVYFGDTLEILKYGVGHNAGSYFPGEGGSIIYMGHNSKDMLRRFSELKVGNEIKVTTTYGEYKYKIYDMQVIKETELEKMPIQSEKEILMIYTCYPFTALGHTTQRYVVYAELEK